VDLVKSAVGAQQPDSQVALQKLKLDKPKGAERVLLKYSALGHAVVGLAGTVRCRGHRSNALSAAPCCRHRGSLRSTDFCTHRVLRVLQALSSMPFGAPLAAAMGALFKQSVKVWDMIESAALLMSGPASSLSHPCAQAAKASSAAQKLLVKVQKCDRQVSKLVQQLGKNAALKKRLEAGGVPCPRSICAASSPSPAPAWGCAACVFADGAKSLTELTDLMLSACKLFNKYSTRARPGLGAWLERLLLADADAQAFATLNEKMQGAMHVSTCMCHGRGGQCMARTRPWRARVQSAVILFWSLFGFSAFGVIFLGAFLLIL
jgi:hypothetical protein